MRFSVRRLFVELFALAGPAVAVICWGWGIVVGQTPAWGSATLQSVAWWSLTAVSFHEGRLPLWNPYSGFGAPLAANPQAAVFSPFVLLLFVTDPAHAVAVSLLFHALLASLGMYVAARRLGISPAPASVAAATFPFVLSVAPRAIFPSFLDTISWLGWAMACCPRPEERRYLPFLGSAAVLALAWLDGHPQAWLLVLVAAGAGWIARPMRRNVLVFAGAVLLALGIAAVQAIPAFELLANATRSSGLPPELTRSYDPPVWTALLGLAPGLLGLPAAGGYRAPIGMWEWAWYPGLATFGLAIVGMRRSNRRLTVLLLGSVLAAYLPDALALAGFDLAGVPALLRGAGRVLVLADTALVLLAARGFETLLFQPEPRSRFHGYVLAAGLGVALAGALGASFGGGPLIATGIGLAFVGGSAILGSRSHPWKGFPSKKSIAIAVLSLNAVELVVLTRPLMPVADRAQAPGSTTISGTRLTPELVFVRAFQARFPYQSMTPDPALADFDPDLSNAGWSDGRRDLPSYDPLRLSIEDRVVAVIGGSKEAAANFGVTEIATFDPISRRITTLKLAEPAPRFSIVTDWDVVPSIDEALQSVANRPPGLDRAVIGVTPGSVQAVRGATKGTSTVSLPHDDPEHLNVNVVAAAPGILRILDAHYPGWKATVDGKSAPVLRVDGAFRGVEVPEGRHNVGLIYSPASLEYGAAISLLSLAVFVWLFGYALKTKGAGTNEHENRKDFAVRVNVRPRSK